MVVIERHRLAAAHDAVRRELLAARGESGHWVGVNALAVVVLVICPASL